MTYKLKLFIVSIIFLLSGCYPGISGKVVDGITGNPIEGAVVLAQWTTTGGMIGLTHHNLYKIEETETDNEGGFSISGVYNPFVDPPEMVIYKKGYVPWRNDMDFMNSKWTHYKKNIWQDDMTYKLEYWKEGYSKEGLSLFVNVMGSDSNRTPKFSEIKSEISTEAQKEIDDKKKMKKSRGDK